MPGSTLTLALLAAALAAPDAPAAKPSPSGPEDVTLAAPPFETHGFSKKDKDIAFYSEHFAQRLTANGVQVITTQQITSVREMDKLRQLAGCPATSADCIIELGHMLGAQGVLRGTLAKVGETLQVDVRVYNASDGKVVVARSVNARTSEALLRALDQMAVETAAQVKTAFGVAPPPKPPEPPKPPLDSTPPVVPLPAPPPPAPPSLQSMAWVPAVGALAAGFVGGGLFVFSAVDHYQLVHGVPSYRDAQAMQAQGELLQKAGIVVTAAGGASLLVAGAFHLFGAPKSAVSVVPAPSGVMVEVKLP